MAKTKLTARTVQSLKPGEKRIQLFDADQKGLAIRVAPSGVKTWSVVYKWNGRMLRHTLGTYPAVSLAAARERAREALRNVANGIDPQRQKKTERLAETFEELAADYMERWARRRGPDGGEQKKSWREDQRIINAYLLPRFRRVRAKDVGRADVRIMLEAIAETAPVQANRVLACLRKIYNWGIGQDLVEHNPCQALQRPGVERRRDRVLSEDELRRVWQVFDAEGPEISALFKLRLLTAQRGGEVATMRSEDLDLKAGWWTIPAEFSKNKMPHRVPLSAPAVRILEELRKDRDKSKNEEKRKSPWVLPHRRRFDEPIGEMQKAAQRIRANTALDEDPDTVVDFTPHDLRRTAASMMTGMKIPRLVVGRILNHAEPGVTAVYDRHSYDAEKKEALDAWAVRLMAIM
jgi:integrase